MIASNDCSGGDNKVLFVDERQDVTGFGFLTPLISNRVATFLGNGVRTIEIQFSNIQQFADHSNTVVPNLLEAPISTPLAEMVGDSIWAHLLLLRMLRISSNWKRIPLTDSVEPIQDVVEHAIEQYFANIATLGGTQIRFDMRPKRFG